MSCYVRRMGRDDVAQVTELDREAFPTQMPPPNYQSELRNQIAHFIVVCDEDEAAPQPPTELEPKKRGNWFKRFFSRILGHSDEPPTATNDNIIGFLGLWVMADEAHITSIAVREAHRRQGIGELLIISAVDLAMELKADILTLEVRVSNTNAQSLYAKYGFVQVGVRRAYYTDNREDAIIMSTDKIGSERFQARFQQLKQAYTNRRAILTRGTLLRQPAPR